MLPTSTYLLLTTSLSNTIWRIIDWGHLAPFSDLFPSFIDGRQISRGRICRRVVWWKQRKQHAETTVTTVTTRGLWPLWPLFLFVSMAGDNDTNYYLDVASLERDHRWFDKGRTLLLQPWEHSWLCCAVRLAIWGRFSIVSTTSFFGDLP